MQVVKDALRWVAVLPAAFAAWLIACMVVGIVMWFNDFGPAFRELSRESGFGDRWLMGPLLVILRSAIGGYFGTLGAAFTAPRAQRETGFVVAGLFTALGALFFCFVLVMWNRDGRTPGDVPWRFVCEILPGLIAAYVAASKVAVDPQTGKAEVE